MATIKETKYAASLIPPWWKP